MVLFLVVCGCASHKPVPEPPRPDVSPTAPPVAGTALKLDRSHVEPMYTELLAIDLPAVVRTAVSDNLAIQRARLAVKASRGRYESTLGAIFPVLVPTAVFDHVDGSVRATEGNIENVAFNTFQPSIALQLVVNPGRVIYDIIASKKRLAASNRQEEAVVLETLRLAVVRYYDLVLAQARLSAARQGVREAEELVRINRLRTRTGAGVPADELRAEARLARRRQELVISMKDFYDASVALAVTLHLDASVTLAPSIDELPPIHLVRRDIPMDELLGFAVAFRPDLKQVRLLVEASTADKGATWWGALGPQFEASSQYGGITGHADNFTDREGIPNNIIVNPASPSGSFTPNPVANGFVREILRKGSARLGKKKDQSFAFSDQFRTSVRTTWRLSISAFGDLKTAEARRDQARIDALRKLDQVKAEVVTSAQASKANRDLIELSQQQVAAAEEALRLSEANLQAGTMTTLDVLESQDSATHARLHHAEAVVRYNQSQVNLLAALGLLDESALVPPQADSDIAMGTP